MSPEEVAAICAEVLAAREREPRPMTEPLPLSFRNGRFLLATADLDPGLLRQAVAVGQDGLGRRLSPEEVFGEDAIEEGLFRPEVWDVVDGTGALAYRMWIYGVDNGTVFLRDTIEVVGGISQGGLDTGDPALAAELVAARDRLPLTERPERSCVAQFD